MSDPTNKTKIPAGGRPVTITLPVPAKGRQNVPSKPTPGPWCLKMTSSDWFRPMKDGQFVDLSKPENAFLVAAAPDYHEAAPDAAKLLRDVEKYASKVRHAVMSGQRVPVLSMDAMDDLRLAAIRLESAIAKATVMAVS